MLFFGCFSVPTTAPKCVVSISRYLTGLHAKPVLLPFPRAIPNSCTLCSRNISSYSQHNLPIKSEHSFIQKNFYSNRKYCRNFSKLSKECCVENNLGVHSKKFCGNHLFRRLNSNQSGQSDNKRRTTTVIYFCAVGIFMVGASYAGVPLYRIFCQATGLGGQAVQGHDADKVETMLPVSERVIKIRFNADVASSMQWNFKPQQTEVKVLPGETALAFYTATNPTDKPIIGISTYNVIPFEAGQYFNKIQCFCFEEQRLNPHEQVDMPVFFYIDPEFAIDPKCANTETITLSYTFFEAKEGLELPYPGYMSGGYVKTAQ